jgi:hypothetical protein
MSEPNKLEEITEKEFDDFLKKKIQSENDIESFLAFQQKDEKENMKRHLDIKYYKQGDEVYTSYHRK